jgi:hypothetical protein
MPFWLQRHESGAYLLCLQIKLRISYIFNFSIACQTQACSLATNLFLSFQVLKAKVYGCESY